MHQRILATMAPDLLSALILFAFVSSITPGPNNLMLMASGANYGFARTLPHMLGVGLGFVVLLLCVGAGLVQVFEVIPHSQTALKLFALLYMSWLAAKIALAAPGATSGPSASGPLTFLEAAAFQWVNPKGWMMALSAIAAYAPSQSLAAVGLVALIFGAINLPCVSVWTVLGQEMRRLLGTPQRLRAFNWTMAALLMLSLWPILTTELAP